MTNEKEIAEIIQRNKSWLISMAGLDAGLTDYSLRHDLLRLLELAGAINPSGGPAETDHDSSDSSKGGK